MRYFEILAATAYKEFMHRLSGESIKRLQNSGVKVGHQALEKAGVSLYKKYPVDILHNEYSAYMPTLGEARGLNRADRVAILSKPEKAGKLLLRKDASGLELAHEMLEKHYGTINKLNKGFFNSLGHNNPGVLVQEKRLLNQSGMQSTLRKTTGENETIERFLPKKDRLRSRDYKRAIKSMNGVNWNNPKNFDGDILKTIQEKRPNRAKEIWNNRVQIRRLDKEAQKHGFYNIVDELQKNNKAQENGEILNNVFMRALDRVKPTNKDKVLEYLNKKQRSY